MPIPPNRSITLIYSPYHVGIREKAVGAGPLRIRHQGLLPVLKQLDVTVHEHEIEPVDDFEGDVGRSFELYRRTSKLVTAARDSNSLPIVVAGNCGASVGVHAGLSAALGLEDTEVGCVWFDAHDDFNVPDSMTSGYFDSQGIAIMSGQCWKALAHTIPGYRPLNLEHFVHVGLRDVNDLELGRVQHAGFPVIWGDREGVDYHNELLNVISQRPIDPTMVHVDMDCLSGEVGQVNKYKPEPGGLSADDLLGCMEMLPTKTEPLSLTIASYDPAYDEHDKIAGIAVTAISAFVESLIKEGKLAHNMRTAERSG